MASASVVNGKDHNGDVPFESEEYNFHEESEAETSPDQADTTVEDVDDGELPQCKIRRNYACPECSYFTQNPRFFLYHLKNVHKQKIRIYECPNCLYASKHSQKLQRHVQMVHVMGGDKKKEPKPPPQHNPPEEEEGEEEAEEVEDEEDPENSKESEECVTLPDNKVYRCPSCPFTSRMQTLVTRHEKVVHLKKKFFKCVKCNYVTHMKARFTKHVKYHSMPMIKCEMCDFKTPYKWNLDRHMKNHMNDGAFKCSICNFTADIKQSLTVHEMNHHVPPVGHVAGNKRKNRVGASDLQEQEDEVLVDHEREDAELLRLEREGEIHQAQMHAFSELSMLNEIEITKKPDNSPHLLRKPIMKKPKAIAQFNAKELTVRIGEKVVNPGDVIQHKNGTVYVKKLKCRVCNYRAAWESEMTRHEQRVHGFDDKKGIMKPARPIPNLIPIQNKPSGQGPTPPPPPALSIPPPPPPLPLMPPSRPMMHQKPMMHQPHPLQPHPHFQQSMNRHPFLSQHPAMHQFQTHNLPPQYPQIPSRFAQPKNIMQKMKRPFPGSNQMPKPIQPRPSPPPLPPPPILKIPTPTKVRNASTPPATSSPDKAMTEKDLNDICAKSCPTSALKDFASLMGGDEAFKPDGNSTPHQGDPGMYVSKNDQNHDSVNENHSIDDGPKSPEAMKKKNSFFDELKEKFGAGESCNLVCNLCGHESKCLSESLRHQKIHNVQPHGNSSVLGTIFSGADLSSTRCQYCRQRCKTSADLLVHLKSCTEANKSTPETINIDDDDEREEYGGEMDGERMEFDDNEGEEDYKYEDGEEDPDGLNPPHPMENKVFVWTNLANGEEDGLDDEYDCGSQSPNSDCVFGIETAPGIGAVTSKNKAATHGNITGQIVQPKEAKPKPDNSVKKVYKCPHCSFWASTASRFHVHIVGHLNKKPFECSLCCYRSNWRWDITKHIRLKTVRDSTHQRAKVLMTDETGRRNYSKYNKYLTLMRVHEPAAESSGTGQRGKKITQSFEPIETLPAPPKLTPAPQSALQENNGSKPCDSPTPMSQFRTIYPKPPPLQPSIDMKRKGPENSEEEPPKKRGLLENKKTMWKCKKCLFRDGDRAVVLAHVKGHYRNPGAGGMQTNQTDTPDERHCRLKHNGDVKVSLAPRQNPDETPEKTDEESEPESYMCETCPFVGNSQQSLEDHVEKHFERTGAPLKCYFCAFYVSDKEELMEHISLHGEADTEDGFPREDESSNIFTTGGENGDLFMNKRYRCSACPYVSNSKTQFLYHKQFHRPRRAPFQCSLCSYNVPRRHFLQQHLRLHGINTPLPRSKNSDFVDNEAPLNIKEIDTSNMTEIPLVWVSKLGSLTKMFKCRYCPHVNIRKSNIQEHEKMHGIRTKPNPEGTSPIPQQQHHCPECNYICNNAGVLSSHARVHQGLFGQVCGLVDSSRSDEDQIKDLNTLLGREEEGPPEISPDEINKDFKDTMSPPLSVQSTPEKDLDKSATDNRVLHFCSICPARFLYPKELEIHLRFHNLQLQFQCDSCSYTARQQPHLLAHYKVHTDEYQDRTNALCEVYQTSEEHPKPKIAVIVDGSEEVGPAWVVVERQKMPAKDPQNEYDLDEAPSETSQHGNRIVTKQFACEKCPATFFKSVALQYHATLHGGPGPHKCRVCDYSVKTYGNLIKHETVHEELEPRAKLKSKPKRPQENVPMSGTELFKQKTEANQKVAASAPPPPPPLHIDPEFGILMHGSPEFIYPTYLKNGRLKEKRYKCHKCPSAFEKREQYKVHLSLHGSKQRYNCERCDYSVKYYANYIQHLRKHQSNDACRAERKTSTDKNTEDSPNDEGSETTFPEIPTFEDIQPQPPITSRSSKKMQLSMADQQTMMLMQQRVTSSSVSAPEVTNRCPHCPYSNQRKDGVGSHVRCHSNVKGGAFPCKYCDYTVPQQHFLREHNKFHFTPWKSTRPEAYMKCDRLELWAEPIVEIIEDKTKDESLKKMLIFKDRGVNSKENRFLPTYSFDCSNQPEEENKEKIYINLKTGEVDTSNVDSIENSEKEDEKENLGIKSKDKSENILALGNESESLQLLEKSVESAQQITENKVNILCGVTAAENDNDCSDKYIPMEVDDEKNDELVNSPVPMLDEENSGNLVDGEQSVDQLTEEEENNLLAGKSDEHCDSFLDNDEEDEAEEEELNHAIQTVIDNIGNQEATDDLADQESQESNAGEEAAVDDLQDCSTHQSDAESGSKSEVKGTSSGTSDSDTEDSSSDSSSSSGDSDDSSSSSVTSSQQP
uniref:C2H2-type domain-containing protein n=1 Tax=Graphocephala atropunctata TaxID=36148 RepID=A0A1B6M9Q0_9HEMI